MPGRDRQSNKGRESEVERGRRERGKRERERERERESGGNVMRALGLERGHNLANDST